MKKFKHTRRSGFAFVLFSPVTLFIVTWVMMGHARKEVNSMHEGRPEYKKSMPFIVAGLLGLITLFIVPIVWTARLADKIRRLSIEHNVEKKPVSAAWMVNWNIFGSFILVGPWVAFIRFFRSLNRLEKKLNEEMEAAENEVKEEQKEGEEVVEPVEENKEGEQKPVEEKPVENNVVEEKPVEEKPVDPNEPEVIVVLPPEKRRYRVRMAGNKNVIRYFETKEEAIAFAKGIAKARKVNVIVKR